MSLPSDQPWPPYGALAMYAKMAEWAAWYSGEPQRIIDVYARINLQGVASVPWWRFWSRARSGADGNRRAELHVPVASDLAGMSAALLFGDAPRVRIAEAHTPDDEPDADDLLQQMEKPLVADGQGNFVANPKYVPPKKPGTGPKTAPQRTEERMLQWLHEGDVFSRFVEAATGAAAIGGVYIYPVWDKNIRDFPIFAIAQADQALPEFSYGFLTAVTFHRTIGENGGKVYRHLQRHEVQGQGAQRKCVVLNGLYVGSDSALGTLVELSSNPETANLAPVVTMPFADLDVEYVPNIRPNRLWRASGYGVADIQGSETLLDAIDETYASWMRDVRLAKARIVVPREFLRPDPNARSDQQSALSFDIDQEVYTPLDLLPGDPNAPASQQMLAHQFQIRYAEHEATALALIQQVVSNAGYSPESLGFASAKTAGHGASSASAMRVVEHKTLLTLRRKSNWWKTAIENTLYRMMLIDAEIFGETSPAIRPKVEISDSIIDQPLELAQTALALTSAQSASVETRVRLVHPDWSEDEIQAETERIKDEENIGQKAAVPEIQGPNGPSSPQHQQNQGAFGNPMDSQSSTHNMPVTGPPGPMPASGPPPATPNPPQK